MSCAADGAGRFVYLLVVPPRAEELSAMAIGIIYKPEARAGIDIFEWNLCASREMATTGWPASGTGNMILWDEALSTHTAAQLPVLAGYFYLASYGTDQLSIVAHPRMQDISFSAARGEVELREINEAIPGFHVGGLVSCVDGDDKCFEFTLCGTINLNQMSDEPLRYQDRLDVPSVVVFSKAVHVNFTISMAGNTSLALFDINGRSVRSFFSQPLPAGAHSMVVEMKRPNGTRLSSGQYFLLLTAPAGTMSRRITVIK